MTNRRTAFLGTVAPPSVDNDNETTFKYHSLEDHTERQEGLYMPSFPHFKSCSLLIGLLVGLFIQFSTLGANFMVITLWGQDVITKSKAEVVIFSLVWSFFTSLMAIVILGFLRSIVSMVFTSTATTTSRNHESILEELVLHMECRFVVGALVGVCVAWTLTDVLLGMKAQIIYSLITLAVALLWCRSMMWFFTRNEKSVINELVERPSSSTSASTLPLSTEVIVV